MFAHMLPFAASVSKPFTGIAPNKQFAALSTSRGRSCLTSAAQSSSPAKTKPGWAGEDALSKAVNFLISIPILFSGMKVMARNVMQNTAEGHGVPWRKTLQTLERSEVYAIKEQLEDKSLQYPSYYTRQFHGYDQGNLNWLAAFEVESATYAISLRCFKEEKQLTPEQAHDKLRGGVLTAIKDFSTAHGVPEPRTVLDIGCSAGMSTRWLADAFPAAQVTGLDLSPYFLAVAELRRREAPAGSTQGRIRYMHANAEATGLPSASQDLTTVQFTIHECPEHIIASIIAEARRLLRPGGMLVVVDNNPKSPVIQNLPPVLFTLMKSTEPWSDEYYLTDVEALMRQSGFKHVVSRNTDPRHRAVLAIAA